MSAKKRIMMIKPGKRFPRMGFAPPLGLLMLISMLREHFPERFSVQLVEQTLYNLSAEQVKKKIADFKPDLVCFSCLSVEAGDMHELAAISKSMFPDTPVWVGGPHASVFYDLELESGNVDAVCIGEGEQTFLEMIRAWIEGKPLDEVPGLALMREGRVVTTPPRDFILDLDSLPLPAWDLVDFNLYGRQISMNGFVHSTPWSIIFTSRACPYQCVYCHGMFGKKVRKRSAENVMKELELLVHTYGIKEIHIVDDIFNLDLERAKTICDRILERGLKIKIAFPNGLRGDRMDRELIAKLKAAGCYSITYAIETASPRLQKAIRKNLDLDKLREAIAWADQEGIITQAFNMLGFPGETPEEMKMTIDYNLNSRLTRAWFFTVVVYPRTGLYELARQEYPDFDFGEYDFFKFRYFAEEPFYTRATGVDVYKVQRHAYRAFFLRPRIIAKIITRFPKNRWFFIGIYWGLRSVFTSLTKVEMSLQRALRNLKDWWLRRTLAAR